MHESFQLLGVGPKYLRDQRRSLLALLGWQGTKRGQDRHRSLFFFLLETLLRHHSHSVYRSAQLELFLRWCGSLHLLLHFDFGWNEFTSHPILIPPPSPRYRPSSTQLTNSQLSSTWQPMIPHKRASMIHSPENQKRWWNDGGSPSGSGSSSSGGGGGKGIGSGSSNGGSSGANSGGNSVGNSGSGGLSQGSTPTIAGGGSSGPGGASGGGGATSSPGVGITGTLPAGPGTKPGGTSTMLPGGSGTTPPLVGQTSTASPGSQSGTSTIQGTGPPSTFGSTPSGSSRTSISTPFPMTTPSGNGTLVVGAPGRGGFDSTGIGLIATLVIAFVLALLLLVRSFRSF